MYKQNDGVLSLERLGDRQVFLMLMDTLFKVFAREDRKTPVMNAGCF